MINLLVLCLITHGSTVKLFKLFIFYLLFCGYLAV